jgi:hypothetical protein
MAAVSQSSLQHPYDMQLLTHEDLHENIYGIKHFCVSQADITENETQLRECFSNGMQITNTTESHGYIPVNTSTRVFSFWSCVLGSIQDLLTLHTMTPP